MPAASFYLPALKKILDQTLSITSTPEIKVALLGATYEFNPAIEFFDTGTDNASDPSANVIVATNYEPTQTTVGTSISLSGNGFVMAVIADTSFGPLGGAVNDTIHSAVLYFDTGNLSTSPVIAWIPIETPYLTNGNIFVADFETAGAGGQLQILLPSQSES